MDNLCPTNKDKLKDLTYDGKRNNWPLGKILTAHVACHGISLKLAEYGHGELSEQQKLPKLHQGTISL